MEITLINQDWYLITKDVLTVLFTLAGLIIAGLGLATWKKQIKGSKEFEAAHNLHFAMLKLREAIKHVRNPAIWPSESQRAVKFIKEKNPEKSDEELKKNEHAYVYEMRWQKITDAYTEAESYLLEAEALWGHEIMDLTKPLNKKVRELNINLNQNFASPEMRTKDLMAIHDVIYDKSSETEQDAFSTEVSKSIDAIAGYLRGKIK
ncbi:MAG: hypothetical protein A3G46_00930 [Candidatus Zambryskibacteria bacterium RIFCSPLOWO2_12_FULL_39_16]|uniref:Uncharacterized protein n=1 Tax=Candidatus Zambryskibacteria bacterium RIFCSPLOWO2_12_FULL_39_16 TaxID=1802775 RepID=A0A1G2USZ2_9BACT|nr:MAG: hypothetical protein A3G46_00930 [Candidatus Zambryskibacteria bacterium RIFCSPLOWO2_12_FULL_39_16]